MTTQESRNKPRVRRMLHFTFEAPMNAVFPLLCPVREYDWIEEWTCELIHSKSGFAEDNCVFQTARPGAPIDTWVVSHYEPPKRIEFVITNQEFTTRMNLALSERSGGGTCLDWEFIMTGLGDVSAVQLEQMADVRHSILLMREAELAHYLATGRMLKRGKAKV
jgi:hypothetical protein